MKKAKRGAALLLAALLALPARPAYAAQTPPQEIYKEADSAQAAGETEKAADVNSGRKEEAEAKKEETEASKGEEEAKKEESGLDEDNSPDGENGSEEKEDSSKGEESGSQDGENGSEGADDGSKGDESGSESGEDGSEGSEDSPEDKGDSSDGQEESKEPEEPDKGESGEKDPEQGAPGEDKTESEGEGNNGNGEMTGTQTGAEAGQDKPETGEESPEEEDKKDEDKKEETGSGSGESVENGSLLEDGSDGISDEKAPADGDAQDVKIPSGSGGAENPADKEEAPAETLAPDAEEKEEEEVPADAETPKEETPEEEDEPEEEIPAEEELLEEEQEEDVEAVIFNTGNCEFHVVSREDFDKELGDAFFEEDGSYTIQIPEENPFFPYEVQFTYDGETTEEWFMEPDDHVKVGGHTFYVSAYFDGTVMTQMSLEIAGDTVVVYPEEKEFTNDGGASAASLLPLEERKLTVDLTRYTPVELTMVSVDSIFTGDEKLGSGDHVMWRPEWQNEYAISSPGDYLDWSDRVIHNGIITWEMIVGDVDQLAADNIRYRVEAEVTDPEQWLLPVIYAQDAQGTRIPFKIVEFRGWYYNHAIDIVAEELVVGDDLKFYVGLKLNPSVFQQAEFDDLEVYKGYFKNAKEIGGAENITEQLFAEDMLQSNAGFLRNKWSEDITILTYKSGKVTGCLPLRLRTTVHSDQEVWRNRIVSSLYGKKNDVRENVELRSNRTYDEKKENYEYCRETIMLAPGYDPGEKYQLVLKIVENSDIPSDVTAAYLGRYTSIKEATDAKAKDIKSELFDNSEAGGYEADYSNGVYFTIFTGEDGANDQKIYHRFIETREYKGISSSLYKEMGENGGREEVSVKESDDLTYDIDENVEYCQEIKELKYGFSERDLYHLVFRYDVSENDASSEVTAAFVGIYSSIKQATAAGAKDIKALLFDNSEKGGYEANYSGEGIDFTVFIGKDGDANQEIYQRTISTIEHEIDFEDELLEFTGLLDKDGRTIKSYKVDKYMDSYGDYNFLTFLVEESADLTHLAPEFYIEYGKLYAEDGEQISGKSLHDFSKGPVQYTVNQTINGRSKNYWLQVLKPESGQGKLYINSLASPEAKTKEVNGVTQSVREIFIDGLHGSKHDILLINTGSSAIPALSVELDSNVVELDEYWTLKGKWKLAGFSGIRSDERENMAIVRLKAKYGAEGMDASGTLTFKSGNTILLKLTLTGMVGDPMIITKDIPPAVKYVPYGIMIQNSNKYGWNNVRYSLKDGALPEGMKLKSNGEIYGVPTEAGEFTFTVNMVNSSSELSESNKEFTLIVSENTDNNVDAASDEGYEVIQRVPDITLDSSTDYTFISKGDFSEFVALYLDGVELARDLDYIAEEGSTKMTVRSQTLKASNKTGTHTLGAEFRTKDNTLKRTAQNYDVKGTGSSSGENGAGSGTGSGSGSGNGSSSGIGNGGSSGSSGKGSGHSSGSSSAAQSASYTDASWSYDASGWRCKNPDGSWLASTWQKLPWNGNEGWYYFNAEGYMATGWLTIDGQTYYLNPASDGTQGKMCTGWRFIDGSWRYFNEAGEGTEGAMAAECWRELIWEQTKEWYYFDKEGRMATGWLTSDGQKYYLNPNSEGTRGKMYTGWQQIDGKWYYFNEISDGTKGALATNTRIGNYYVDSNGVRTR